MTYPSDPRNPAPASRLTCEDGHHATGPDGVCWRCGEPQGDQQQ